MDVSAVALSNPTLHYRLDPGEPGLRQARASESALWVTAQERRNIRRLEAEARAEGQQVVYENITYLFGRDGSYSSIRAGHTVVVTRQMPASSPASLAAFQQDQQQTDQPSSVQGQKDEATSHKDAPPGEKTTDELKVEKEQLTQRQTRLEQKVEEADKAKQNRTLTETDPVKKALVERELKEVRQKLREVEEKLQKRRMEEAQQNLSDTLQQVTRAALQPLQMIFGGSKKEDSAPHSPSVPPLRIDLLA